MKKLLIIFLVLLALGIGAAIAGILLARGTAPLGGPLVLTWRLREPLLEHTPTGFLPLPGQLRPQTVGSVYRSLSRARSDQRVRGLALYVENARFGLAKAQEIRGLIADLREAGKFVECYLETAGEGTNGTLAYYLVTACDRIGLAPTGDLNLIGLYADSYFLRGTLEKLRIEPQFHAEGRYKSAGEVFTEYEHTPAAEEAIAGLLDDYYGELVETIATARELEAAEVRRLIDGAPYGAEDALRSGLVDELAYPDEFRERVRELAGGEPQLIELADYRSPPPWPVGHRIAVVFAQGTILRGPGGVQPWTEEIFLGSASMSGLLRQLAEDRRVSAVVLRIDSRGGSALASDLILREVQRLAESKPVVASLSDLAASGGYYIAVGARRIVAQPATLTGSIGVVGGKFVTRRFEQELLGISHDTLKRGDNAGLYSSLEPFSPEQWAIFEDLMARVYGTFIARVAEGRGMSPEEVAKIAEGRIWTGAAARDLGLVDELGGLEQALALAREEAGIPPGERVRIDYYPRPPSLFDLLAQRRPPLPLALPAFGPHLRPRPTELLELPPELARLSRPF